MRDLRNLLGPLRVLDAVCRAGGVSRAAEQLHVTPGAVSQQLKQLESVLGVPLFVKAGRMLEPTAVGRQLASRLADLFDRVEMVVAETMERARDRRLRVKVSPDFAVKWLMPKLANFYELHDDIDLDIATSSRVDDVHLDNADFAIRYGHGEWEDVHSELLFMDELVPICSPPLAATIREPRDLLNVKLVHSMRRPAAWSAWFEKVGLGADTSTRTMALANLTLCIQAAADGLGVAIAPIAYLSEDIASGRIVMPLGRVTHTGLGIYLICDPHKADTRPLKDFREWMRAASQRTSLLCDAPVARAQADRR